MRRIALPVHQAASAQPVGNLPNPFTPADEEAGYRYELSILQAEFSLTSGCPNG